MRPRPICLFLALGAAAGPALAEKAGGEGTVYYSAPYTFGFEAPAPLEIREYSSEALAIGRATPGGGFEAEAEVRVFVAGEGADFPSFENFAFWAVANTCAADGPDETISCGTARQRQPVVTDAGLEGEVLYLDRIHETLSTGAKKVEGFGPVFLFDLSDEIAGDGWAALTVQPNPVTPVEKVDSELLREITASLQVYGAFTEE